MASIPKYFMAFNHAKIFASAGNWAAYVPSDSLYSLNKNHLSSREKNLMKYCICICNKMVWWTNSNGLLLKEMNYSK